MTQEELTIEVPGGQIAVTRAGAGEPALVLHGGPGLTDLTVGLAQELSSRWETIRYQQRGLPPTTVGGPFGVEAHVGDALAVLDGLGLERAWIVGHSWGGHLAMHVAVAAPERMLGVVAVDPLGAVADGGESELDRNLTARLSGEVAAQAWEIEARLAHGEGGEDEAREMMRLVWPYYFAQPEAAPPLPHLALNAEDYRQTWSSVRHHFERGTLASGLARVGCPFLFVHGRESPIPPERSVESAALCANARVEVVPNRGHFAWLEQPGSVLAAVERLLGR